MYIKYKFFIYIMTPLENTDLLFFITEYLLDNESFRLFRTNKFYKSLIDKYPHRYGVKKLVNCELLPKVKKYKIYKLLLPDIAPKYPSQLGRIILLSFNSVK